MEQAAVDVVRLLGAVVRQLRVPLLVVSLAPVLPALVVLLIAATTQSGVAALLGIAGLVPALWLTWRRRQLIGALQPPAVAVAELRATFNAGELGEQLKQNLIAFRPRRGRLITGLAGSLWRGVKAGTSTWSRLTDVPRLAPFLPGRLRGLAVLVVVCLAGAAVLALLAIGLLVGSAF